MSPHTINIIIAIILLLHGLAHGRAFLMLLTDAFGLGSGATLPVRAWLFPSLSRRASAAAASIFWLLPTIGFIWAAWMLWSADVPSEAWRQIVIASAIISTLGSVLFSGIWPGAPTRRMSDLDTVISLVLNGVILVALLLLKWPK
jgi:hypothetical protein